MSGVSTHEVEQRLRFLEAIDGLASDIVIVTETLPLDAPGPRIVHVNEAFSRATGLAVGDVTGRPIGALQPAEAGAPLVEWMQVALYKGSGGGNVAIRSKDGGDVWLDAPTLRPISDGKAAVSHYAIVGRPAPARPTAAQERVAMDLLLAAVLAVVDQPVSVVDDEGIVMLISPAYTRLFGWRPEDLVGRHFQMVMPEKVAPEIAELHERAIYSNEPYQVAHALRQRDKSFVQVQATCAVVTQVDGRRYRIASIKLADGAGQAAEAAPAQDQSATFERVARDKLLAGRGDGTVVAGKLRLVGLEEVKQAMGARWPKVRERALQIASGIIRNRLGATDVFSQTDDDGFVICFAELNEEAAIFKATALADEIRAKFVGELGAPAAGRVSAHATAVPVAEAELVAAGSIAGVLEAKLEEARRQTELRVTALLRDAVDTSAITVEPVYGGGAQRAPIGLVRLPNVLRLQLERAQTTLGHDPAVVLEIDLLTLGLTTGNMAAADSADASHLLMVPVDCTSLLNRSRAEKYLQLCRAMGNGMRQRLLLELHNLPPRVYQLRLAEILQLLSPFARGMVVELTDPFGTALDIKELRVPIVSMDARRFSSIASAVSELGKFSPVLRSSRTKLLVKNVGAAGDARALFKAGVDLMSGPGLQALVSAA